MSTESRVRLLARDQVTAEIAAVYDALLAARGVVPNMFKVLAHTPAIVPAVAGFLKPLLADGALRGSYKELVAVRVSQGNASEYAIRAHSISARQKGATEEQISGVANFESGPYSPKEKLGFRLADKLHESGKAVDDNLFEELNAKIAEPEIVE